MEVNEKKYDRKSKVEVKVAEINGLIKLYDNAIKEKKHPYEKFKVAGYIKNPLGELLC